MQVNEAIEIIENVLSKRVRESEVTTESLGRALSKAPEDMKKEVKALFKILGAPSAVRDGSLIYSVGSKGESFTVSGIGDKYRVKLKRVLGRNLKATTHDLSSIMQLTKFAKGFKKGR